MKTKLLSVDYLGYTAMDRRFSTAMLPWVLLEIRRRGTREKLCLGVECGVLQAFDTNFELQFTHKLQHIMRFTQVQSNPTEFLYLMKDGKEHLLYCYLFQASTVEEVTELFGHMKELAPHSGSMQSLSKSANSGSESSIPGKTASNGKTSTSSSALPGISIQRSTSVATNKGFQLNAIDPASFSSDGTATSNKNGSSSNMATSRSYTTGLNKSGSSLSSDGATGTPAPLSRSLSNAANLTSLCVDISPSNSHFFEVLYVGKIKVSHKKVPESLIDDALGKFRQYEVDKAKSAQMRRNSLLSSQADSISIERDSLESLTVQPTKKVEFAPLPVPYKKSFNNGAKEENLNKSQDGLMSPSLTPLETNKHFFSDEEDDPNDVEKEFDELSAVRVQKLESDKDISPKQIIFNKKSFPVALEPNVLILNFPQNEVSHNLSTLNEDESESSLTNNDDDKSPVDKPENKPLKSFNDNKVIDISDNLCINDKENEIISNSVSHMAKNNNAINPNGSLMKNNVQPLNLDNKSDSVSSLSESRDLFEKDVYDEQLMNGLKNKTMPENKSFTRDRSASIGTLNLNKTPITHLIGDQNRTMLFQVGRSDLRLISPDRKQVLLHKHLRDVSSCVKGIVNKEHFGFICREPDVECFVGYVFKCQSTGVSSDVVGAITQAFVAHSDLVKQGKERSPLMSCEHCPMIWYHKLCQDLEGLNEKRIHTAILRRIDQLVDEEQVQIMTKYQGGTEDLYEVGEHNAFLMMLLRAHCEAKQQRHVHDTAENRSEFLNQYLGGSTIFMKAKRSLSSSFDHLLKRKASKEEFNFKKDPSPISHSLTPTRDSSLDLHLDVNGKNGKANTDNHDVSLNLNGKELHETSPSQLKSPMMDIFMKLGNSPTAKSLSTNEQNSKKSSDNMENDDSSADRLNNQGSWRQAIFNRVIQAGTLAEELESTRDSTDSNDVTAGELLRRPSSYSNLNQAQFTNRKRSKEEIRELWKKGINQAILLIRMEKENARLRARQEVSAVKRIKLEYGDIGGCGNENSKVWDMLTAPRDSRISTRVDSQMLLQAIRQGVPRAKRGEVWYFLAEQFCLRQPPPDIKNFPNYNVPYESLLKQLTSHQHAILIDLGRTFPNHTYFASPLGPGQLALFNLLKAYSLLDPEVGYCQGLSFVAGVLLLHLEEAEAFIMLRHLMFRRGLRKQYLPDMTALQIQLYQLSRLLKDHIPELYERFDQYDVSPTLYAAPWILTIFTSQFPLGFVTRVFDLLFLESSEVIFRVAIALLDIHKDGIMVCDSFEEIMEYVKHKMPNIDKPMLDKVIKKTFTLDFARQLNEYHVEYNVLQEEMAAIAPKMDELNKLQKQNKKLTEQNRQNMEQIEINASKLSEYQVKQSRLENQIKSLEQTVANLARFIGTTHDKKKDNELPNDIKKICQHVQQNDRKTLGVLGQKLGQSFSSKFSSTDFTNSNGSVSSFSEESSSDPDDKNAVDKNIKKTGILKTGLSTPNLFGKEKPAQQPKVVDPVADQLALEKKRQYLSMKKSYSCNAGLMANPNKTDQTPVTKQDVAVNPISKLTTTLKGYPLRVLDENMEYDHVEKLNADKIDDKAKSNIIIPTQIFGNTISNNLGDQKKGSKFFANSHEQIRQEKLHAEQLKRDFDENLRKLDARLSPHSPVSDAEKTNIMKSPTSPPSMGLHYSSADVKLNLNNKSPNSDSGLGTPVSPPTDKSMTNSGFGGAENMDVNHPLVGCDLDIKFEVQATKLKSIRPMKIGLNSRTSSIDGGDSRN